MRPLFVVQYYRYQYDQLLDFCKKFTGSSQDIAYYDYVINGEKPAIPYIGDVELSQYDYIIYTGMPIKTIQTYASKTRYNFVVYIGHSLVGTIYDSRLVLPTYERSVGVVPECWINFDSFKKVLNEQESPRFVTTIANHIVNEAVYHSFEENPDESACALILGEKSAFETYNKLVLSTDFKKIHVKFHPLTSEKNKKIFSDPRYVIHPTDENKYKFINACGTVFGGQSSLFIESYLRSVFFNKCQKFYELPNRRKTDTGFTEFGSISYNDQNIVYRSMIDQEHLPYDRFKKTLLEVEDRFIKVGI